MSPRTFDRLVGMGWGFGVGLILSKVMHTYGFFVPF